MDFDKEEKNEIIQIKSYEGSLMELTTLREKFAYWKKKVDLYREPLKNQEKMHCLRVTSELYKKPHIKNYIWQIKKEVRGEQNAIQETNEELINKIDIAKKEFGTIKEIIDEKPNLMNEVYDSMVNENRRLKASLYQIDQKLGNVQNKEHALKAEYMMELVHGEKTLKKQPLILGERMIALEKENEYLTKEIERKQLKLSEVQSRIKELQVNISKLTYSLFDFK